MPVCGALAQGVLSPSLVGQMSSWRGCMLQMTPLPRLFFFVKKTATTVSLFGIPAVHSDLLVAFAAYGGNSNGQRCIFPFVYKTELFHSCTNAGDNMGNFWCATTKNYNQDKLWISSYIPSGSCAIPFTYNKQEYHTCTSDGASSGKLWCSTTRNYDVDKKWTYCSTPEKAEQAEVHG
uniref:Fibronectin type-II domain-containing protein n=1 Tax=Terrapene triunguis TaxID=2587831 RepID=A0A674K820_9SAUR